MGSINEKLTYLKETKNKIKEAIVAKGVPVDDNATFRSYPDKITQIETGTKINNQDKTITSNGIYTADAGYTGLGTVNINVASLLPYEVVNGQLRPPSTTFTFSLPDNITVITSYPIFAEMYYGNTALVAVDLHQITQIRQAMTRTFMNCTKIKSVDFSNLKSLDIRGNTFKGTFANCQSLKNLSFPSLLSSNFEATLGDPPTHFTNMLSNVSNATVHFPSNLESVIGSSEDVQNGFGGTGTTVLFDLPATS